MYRHHHWQQDETEDRTAERQTGGLVGMVIVLVLLVVGLFLVQQLRAASLVEDCVMSGRTNCDVAVTGPL